MQFTKFILAFLLLHTIVGCKKKEETSSPLPTTLNHGVLVLNEGLFEHNNASLSYFDLNNGTVFSNFFEVKANRNLGDTGNDIAVYGGKIYIVVNVSSTIEVLDKHTGVSIQQIQMKWNNLNKQPRSIQFYKNHAFVSCFDGYVDVIDTASLQVITRIAVGKNPDAMTAQNNRLYVSNSGGLNSPLMDSTVSVIDMDNLSETQKIVVGKNPGDMAWDHLGNLYVIARGNYSTIPSRLKKINTVTHQLEQSFNFDIQQIEQVQNQLYFSYANGNQTSIGIFDPVSASVIQTNAFDISYIETLYGFQYDPIFNAFYLTDAKNYTVLGDVHILSNSGILQHRFTAGLNPSKLIRF